MSRQSNHLSVYLRPLADQQPYQILNAARWLAWRKKFKTPQAAHKWLLAAESNDPWVFKTTMSEYHQATDRATSSKPARSPNEYRSTRSNLYGDEPHMHF
jgi:hypothetical protein